MQAALVAPSRLTAWSVECQTQDERPPVIDTRHPLYLATQGLTVKTRQFGRLLTVNFEMGEWLHLGGRRG